MKKEKVVMISKHLFQTLQVGDRVMFKNRIDWTSIISIEKSPVDGRTLRIEMFKKKVIDGFRWYNWHEVKKSISYIQRYEQFLIFLEFVEALFYEQRAIEKTRKAN